MDIECVGTVFPLVLTISVITQLCVTLTTQSPSNASYVYPGYDLPVKLTVVVIEPDDGIYFYSLKRVLPVMDIAIEDLNRVYAGIMSFSLAYGNGSCDIPSAGVAAARISWTHNISVFIGPACSKPAEVISYMANDWNVPIITPIASTETIGDKNIFPRLTRISSAMQSPIINTVFKLMSLYKWKNVAFFYDIDYTTARILSDSFMTRFRTTKYQVKQYELSGDTFSRRDYSWRLKDAASKARVLIFCLEGNVLQDIFLEAHSLGYATSGEFAFIVIMGINDVPSDTRTWKFGRDTDETVRQALAQAVFPYVNDSWGTLPSNFSKEIMLRASRDYNFTFPWKVSDIPLSASPNMP